MCNVYTHITRPALQGKMLGTAGVSKCFVFTPAFSYRGWYFRSRGGKNRRFLYFHARGVAKDVTVPGLRITFDFKKVLLDTSTFGYNFFTPLKANMSCEKWMVGRWNFLLGWGFFSGGHRKKIHECTTWWKTSPRHITSTSSPRQAKQRAVNNRKHPIYIAEKRRYQVTRGKARVRWYSCICWPFLSHFLHDLWKEKGATSHEWFLSRKFF